MKSQLLETWNRAFAGSGTSPWPTIWQCLGRFYFLLYAYVWLGGGPLWLVYLPYVGEYYRGLENFLQATRRTFYCLVISAS